MIHTYEFIPAIWKLGAICQTSLHHIVAVGGAWPDCWESLTSRAGCHLGQCFDTCVFCWIFWICDKTFFPSTKAWEKVLVTTKLLLSCRVNFLRTSPNGWSFFIFLLTHSRYLNRNQELAQALKVVRCNSIHFTVDINMLYSCKFQVRKVLDNLNISNNV